MEEVRQSTGEASVFRWGCLLCLQPLPPHFLADSNLSSTLQPFFQEILQLPPPSASQGAGPHLHHSLTARVGRGHRHHSLPAGGGGGRATPPPSPHHPPDPRGWKCALVCPSLGCVSLLRAASLIFQCYIVRPTCMLYVLMGLEKREESKMPHRFWFL